MPKRKCYPMISLKKDEPNQSVLAAASVNLMGEKRISESCVKVVIGDQLRRPVKVEGSSAESLSGVLEPEGILHTDDATSEAPDPENSTRTLDSTSGLVDAVLPVTDTSEPGAKSLCSVKTQRSVMATCGPSSPTNGDGNHDIDIGPSPQKRTKLNSSSSNVEKVSGDSKELKEFCTSCGRPVIDIVGARLNGMSAEEVAELQSPLQQEKRFACARDITLEDLGSPSSRACCFNIIMSKLDEYEKSLKQTQQTIRALRRKEQSLESLVAKLHDKNMKKAETRTVVEVAPDAVSDHARKSMPTAAAAAAAEAETTASAAPAGAETAAADASTEPVQVEGLPAETASVSAATASAAKPHTCSTCGAAFAYNSYLRKHERTHTGEKPFSCATCGAAFAWIGDLRKHERNHTGEKPFECGDCGAAFADRAALRVHERSHTGERPFTCDLCDAAYADSSALRKHKGTHAEKKPFSCATCGAGFTQKCNLRKHERTHTGERPFGCKACGAAFTDVTHLREHERIHTGAKPYSCETCGAAFARSYTLQMHERTHTGEKPHACETCGVAYSRSSDLRRHQRTHECTDLLATPTLGLRTGK